MPERAFDFDGNLMAEFGGRAPYRILKDGGIVLSLELPEGALDMVTALYKNGKGKNLRLLIEVREPERYGQKAQLEGQTKWIGEESL